MSPHPLRQRLIREAVTLGVIAALGIGLSLWWLASPPRLTTPPAQAELGNPTVSAAATTSPSLPSGQLWRPLTDAPVAVAPPPSLPAFKLITLSQRQGIWMALVDPGNGAATERVRTGDTIAGWQVSLVDADGVHLAAGAQQHHLRFAP